MEGDPYPNLLQEKGGMSFPHMVVMDADGSVLAMHEGGRDTDAFAASVESAREVQRELKVLSDKAKNGDEQAAVALLEKQITLNHVGPKEALKRLDSLKGVDAVAKTRFLGLIANAEVAEHMARLTDDEQTHYVCGKAFATMLEAGRVPPEGDSLLYFWYFMSIHAEKDGKVDLMTKAVTGIKAIRRAPPRLVKDLEAKLEKMKGGGK